MTRASSNGAKRRDLREAANERFHRGLRSLKRGLFTSGWIDYESRFDARGRTKSLPQSLWRGQPLDGRRILVYREQGLGDEILFASCAPDLIARSSRCVITCDSRLKGLFQRSFPSGTVQEGLGDAHLANVSADYQIAAGSVPRYTRTSLRQFPTHSGYLLVDQQRLQRWAERYERLGDGLRVGISWQGGRDATKLRHVPWDFWFEILRTRGIQFVNLQYGKCEQPVRVMREAWGVTIHDWPDIDRWSDVDDLAAQIKALDLVITVPNTTAHLAGALGVSTWILLSPAWFCWWILETGKVPWYPSAKVFKKKAEVGWLVVRNKVREALERLRR